MPNTFTSHDDAAKATPTEALKEAQTVGTLAPLFATMDCMDIASDLEKLFAADPAIPGVAVTSGGTLVDLISREKFLSLMATPYGRDLYRSRPISRLLNRSIEAPLCVPESENVGRTAHLALARSDDHIYDPVIVIFPQRGPAVLAMPILLRAVASGLASQMERTAATLEELRRTQFHLIQSEKMASLGALVAGVAHEINTPVGIVLGTATHFSDITDQFAKTMAEGTMRRSDLDSYVKQASEAARLLAMNATRAAELIHSFKRVSVDQTSDERRAFNLRLYVEDVLTSLTPRLKTMPVTVTVDIPTDMDCDTYPGAISQIMTNLVVNSLIHGFEDGRAGHIGITARLTPEDLIQITYSDDGKGIAESDVGKVFDPFYTTRRGSGGTGLGLHVVYNLVVGALGGNIGLTSTPNQGVRFQFQFPRHAPQDGQRQCHDQW